MSGCWPSLFFFFSSRRRHTRFDCDWSSDVCSSDLYVEGTGIGPYEGARVTVEPSGRVRLATGVGTQGQGHFTVFAQIVAEVLGVDATDVHVITGDTREFHWGTGTFASRGAVVAGSACHAAAVAVRGKVLALASRELEAASADPGLARGGGARRRGP